MSKKQTANHLQMAETMRHEYHLFLVQRIVIILLIVSVLLVRPMLLGEEYSTYGLVIMILSVVIFTLTQKTNIVRVSIVNARTGLAVIALSIYLIVQPTVLGSNRVDFALKSSIGMLIVVISGVIVFSDRRIQREFFKLLIVIWAVLGYLSAISLIVLIIRPTLLPVIGFIEILDGSRTYPVFATLSILYGPMTIGDTVLYRFLITFRESGIAQAFLIWGLVYAISKSYRGWIALGLMLGVVSTLSTLGIPLMLVGLAIWKLSQRSSLSIKKAVLFVIYTTMTISALYFAPFIGIVDKELTHGGSFDYRFSRITLAIDSLSEAPIFGLGYFNVIESVSGTNLIASISGIGLFGFFLVLLIFTIPAIQLRNDARWRYISAISPIFITLLIAQPIYNAPFTLLLLLAQYE